MSRHYNKVKKYFSEKAEKYDMVDEQLYWKLSDDLLKKIVEKKIVKNNLNKNKINILDAGAGTGRWSLILHDFFKKEKISSQIDMVDITEKMLNEANKKIKNKNISNSFNSYVGNIEDLSFLEDNYYDVAISFYNVLSFTENPLVAIEEIYKKIKKGGIYVSIVSNKYHSYFFKILTNDIKELNRVKDDSLIRFNDNMPHIHCFTPNEIKNYYRKANFLNVEVFGFPNFVYPNIEETFLEGQNMKNKNILSRKSNFNKIIDLEFSECFNEELAARGNVLLIFGKK
ncbi:MAG: class I SAM-dependent methyltransferase [Candidatus ainarchaeum sp.]|nr:class I SAM-dependent methyltransferase [Candidatus ainarchaeum sp.]